MLPINRELVNDNLKDVFPKSLCNLIYLKDL